MRGELFTDIMKTKEELIKELKEIKKEYYKPWNRRMNGKPTADAYQRYGKRMYEIEALLRSTRIND